MSPLLPPWLLVGMVVVVAGIWWAARRWARAHPGPKGSPPPLHEEILALALVGGLVVAFFWRALLTADVYMPIGGGDLASFFYPLYTFIHRSVQESGELPLWNPYAFSGAPLAADVQSGLWYPPNWLVWFLLPAPNFGADFVAELHRTYAVIEWQLILHYAWAALGMYLWLRALRLLPVAALAGTAAFAFCGFMAAHFGHMPMIFAAAWLPWNLLLVRRMVVGRSWGYALLLGVTLALTFLAGHPQTFLYELLAATLYWAWLHWGQQQTTQPQPDTIQNPKSKIQNLSFRIPHSAFLRPALALLVAAGLSMVQYLPSAELAEQSVRAALSWEEAGQHALQPVGLLNLVLPRIFGSNPTNYWVGWQSTENWGYLGVVALLLAGLALALRRDRITGFALTLGALALLSSLGPFTQFFAWLHGLLPGFNRFRGAGRFLLEVGLATGLLAALGLDGVLRLLGVGEQAPTDESAATAGPLPPQAGRTWRWVLWGLVGICAALILLIAPFFYALFLSTPSIERTATILNDLNIGIVWVVAVTALLWLAARRRLAAGPLGVALAVLLVADLFAPNAAFNPTTDDLTTGYQNPDQIGLLYSKTSDGRFRIDSDTGDVIRLWQPGTGVLMEIPDAGGLYNPLTLARYARVWDRVRNPLPEAPETVQDNRDSLWYDLLNIRYTVATLADRPRGPKFREIDANARGIRIYENTNALPRVLLVHDVQVEPDPEQQFTRIDRLLIDPRHSVLLPVGEPVSSTLPSSAEAGTADQVRITSYRPNRIEMSIHNGDSAAAWLVLSEVWYPGWIATLNGNRVDILQADYLLRAVQVGPGDHTLVLEFRPRLLLIGQLISAATALAVILAGPALWLLGRRRRNA